MIARIASPCLTSLLNWWCGLRQDALSLISELFDLVLQDAGVQLPDTEVLFIKELINGKQILS